MPNPLISWYTNYTQYTIIPTTAQMSLGKADHTIVLLAHRYI